MKVALCLFGLVGSGSSKARNSKSDPKVLKIGYEHYYEHLLSQKDVDVFVHSWDMGFEDEVCKLYEPKDSIFETQIVFEVPSCLIMKDYNQGQAHFSRWYSAKISNDLKSKYEKTHGFKYNCVMSGRFDQAWETDLAFEKFDLNYFYTGYCCELVDKGGRRYLKGGRGEIYGMSPSEVSQLKHIHTGYGHTESINLLDLWFFSNSDYMDRFSTLYDCLDKYYVPGARIYGDSPLKISNHWITTHHLHEIGLLSKLKHAFHLYDDFPLVRRKYFGCKK